MNRGIRAGHDTLADALGDIMYCRARGGEMECPYCGSWTPIKMDVEGWPYTECTCAQAERVECSRANDRWYTVFTADLLLGWFRTKTPERFFLPRAWNQYKPWITFEDLKAMYNEYLKEAYPDRYAYYLETNNYV